MRRVLGLLGRATILGMLAALLVGGSLLLRAGTGAGDLGAQQMDDPLPVSVRPLRWEDGYTVTDRFVGRLEPARQAILGFERGGLVTEVMVEEGDRIEAGTVLALLDRAILRAERDRLGAQRAQAAAALELARLTANRQRTLAGQGHTSSQRFDEARLSADVAAAELAGIDAALRRIDLDLDKSAVLAPFAGTVGARLVDPGMVVSAGTGVLELLETGRPQARVGVAPQAATTLSAGQPVTIQGAAGQAADGTIVAIRPDLSTATRTTTVLIDLAGPPPAAFGDTVALEIVRRIDRRGAWVPVASLSEGDRGLWTVLVAGAGDAAGVAVDRAVVEILHVQGDRVFVTGTLRDGDRLIDAGPHRIVPGQRVAISTTGEGQESG